MHLNIRFITAETGQRPRLYEHDVEFDLIFVICNRFADDIREAPRGQLPAVRHPTPYSPLKSFAPLFRAMQE
jgi:hypothetical protein